MKDSKKGNKEGPNSRQIAFLLSQVGAHASMKFAERIHSLGIQPHHAGILRILSKERNVNQKDLANTLSILPSRLVTFIDELESMGVVVRVVDAKDRRNHRIELTIQGNTLMKSISEVAQEHNEEVCRELNTDERQTLAGLLARLASTHGLVAGVHPGYKFAKSK